VNNVQLSPTVQATRSNYLRKHGGKKTNYLEFFTKKRSGTTVLNKTKLSEQGTRYFEKFNKNILIDIKKKKLNKYSNYIWVNKQNLIQAVKKKNFLNMDTISVFSNSIKRNRIDNPKNNIKKILKKLIYFKRKNKISKKKIFFKDLKNWVLSKNKIFDSKKLFFSILALKINTNSREVKKWHQPIISDHSMSFNGFFLKKINNTNHYLLQMVQEQGFNLPKFTSTVCIKNFSKKNIYSKNYISRFNDKKNFKMDIINSDEGGRFYRNEIRNVICEIKINQKFNLKSNYIWASHNQIIDLIRRNLLSIEARNLFACFNIDKIK